jgi:methionyl-tRNA formyltransferase
MKTIDVVYCGEKPLGLECLRYLRTLPEVKIVAVCTRGNSKPLWYGYNHLPDYCQAEGIPVVSAKELTGFQYDVLISVLYPFILEGSVIERARQGAFNLHEAPLPRWRGCNGYSHAIMMGDEDYGTTLHVMEPVLDAGDIIAAAAFPIAANETARELYLRTSSHSLELFREWAPRILRGEYQAYAPDATRQSFLNGRNSLAPFKELPPGMTLAEAYQRTLALDFLPWEPAYTTRSGRKYYFFIADGADRSGELVFDRRAASTQRIEELEPVDGGMLLIEGFNRPLVVCDETTYRARFPLLA